MPWVLSESIFKVTSGFFKGLWARMRGVGEGDGKRHLLQYQCHLAALASKSHHPAHFFCGVYIRLGLCVLTCFCDCSCLMGLLSLVLFSKSVMCCSVW